MTCMRPSLLVLISLLGGLTTAHADTVHLHHGGEIHGDVRAVGDTIVIELPSGTITMASDAVRRVEQRPSPIQVHDERRVELGEQEVVGRLALARYCRSHAMPKRERVLLLEVLAIDRGNAEAHDRLRSRRPRLVKPMLQRASTEESPRELRRARRAQQLAELQRSSAEAELERARIELQQVRQQVSVQQQESQVAEQKAAALAAARDRDARNHHAHHGHHGHGHHAVHGHRRADRCDGRTCGKRKIKKRRLRPAPSYYSGRAHREFAIAGVKHPRSE